MNFFEKRKLRSLLQPCNFQLAGEVIHSKFASKTGQNALTELIRDYMADPGFEMAVKLIEFEPQLAIYFVECNPDGFYARQMQKKMIDTQEHQAFLAHITGEEGTGGRAQAAATTDQAEQLRSVMAEASTEDRLPPRGKVHKEKKAEASSSDNPSSPLVRDFSNVIQTLRDSVRELQLQVLECEREIAELEKIGSNKVDMQRKWLTVCKEGIKEFESAIRVLQSEGSR